VYSRNALSNPLLCFQATIVTGIIATPIANAQIAAFQIRTYLIFRLMNSA
jgi:hypothetical protein